METSSAVSALLLTSALISGQLSVRVEPEKDLDASQATNAELTAARHVTAFYGRTALAACVLSACRHGNLHFTLTANYLLYASYL